MKRIGADKIDGIPELLRSDGIVVIENILEADFLDEIRSAMYAARDKLYSIIGEEKLVAAREVGVLRTLLSFDSIFFRCIEIPEILRIINLTVSETAIMHLQNGFILPPAKESRLSESFQNSWHMDFPRVLNGYLTSINIFFLIDEFSAENGATRAVPGSHQMREKPTSEYLARMAIDVEAPAGSIIVFDSTIWHCAGINNSNADRLGINHQFTRSFFKQQMDYCRVLGEKTVQKQRPRTQQLLGWFSRPPASLEEFYVPTDQRTYRQGQG
jgi:ectoine hydroxylase-related dioxygenase (phytanoyl-CoA dioxygenase family)